MPKLLPPCGVYCCGVSLASQPLVPGGGTGSENPLQNKIATGSKDCLVQVASYAAAVCTHTLTPYPLIASNHRAELCSIRDAMQLWSTQWQSHGHTTAHCASPHSDTTGQGYESSLFSISRQAILAMYYLSHNYRPAIFPHSGSSCTHVVH